MLYAIVDKLSASDSFLAFFSGDVRPKWRMVLIAIVGRAMSWIGLEVMHTFT